MWKVISLHLKVTEFAQFNFFYKNAPLMFLIPCILSEEGYEYFWVKIVILIWGTTTIIYFCFLTQVYCQKWSAALLYDHVTGTRGLQYSTTFYDRTTMICKVCNILSQFLVLVIALEKDYINILASGLSGKRTRDKNIILLRFRLVKSTQHLHSFSSLDSCRSW